MSISRGQKYYLGGVFLWLFLAQGALLWYVTFPEKGVCNSFSAWPFQFILPGLFVSVITLLTIAYAWKILTKDEKYYEWPAWAVISATGISHSTERVFSGCILDYWHLPFFERLFFNIGDVGLCLAIIFLTVVSFKKHF